MDISPILQKLYPSGSIGGQCGDFAHKLVDFPSVGDSYREKQQAILKYGIPAANLAANFAVGDVVITSEGTFLGFGSGHVAVINFINQSGIFLTESNFHNDGKVTHGRRLDKTSPKICGVIRGNLKFPVSSALPVQIRMTILMNQPIWPSMLSKMAELQDWYFRASGGRIQLIIDNPVQTALSGWQYRVWGPGSNLELMDKSFMDSKVTPLAGTNIVLFVIAGKDWARPHDALQETDGYCWTDNGQIKAYIVCDENEKSQTYPNLDAFFDYARHEIAHGLYALGAQFDFCHNRYYGQNGYPRNFDLIFQDFDYSLLERSVF